MGYAMGYAMGYGRLASRARRLEALELPEMMAVFARWLTPPKPGAPFRTRLLPPAQTLWLFLSQTLSADKSCREAVRKWLAWLAARKGQSASPATAAYCKARQRLALAHLGQAHRAVVWRMAGAAGKPRWWLGRAVKIVDGTGLSMPDTKKNQQKWPQPKEQKPGCGFPVMRVVALFCMATGAIIAWAHSPMSRDERSLFRTLWDRLEAADVVLADRGFCSFVDLWLLARRGVDCVMRKNQARTTGVRKLRSLGKGDVLVQWLRGYARPRWMNRRLWRATPRTLALREITFATAVPGFRTKTVTLATTLLDPKAFPKEAFADLYRLRWRAELCLRDVKTSLRADVLRCKTPAMILKETSMMMLAYNLVRALMGQAAARSGADPFRLSFKGALATIRQWAPAMAYAPLTRRQHDLMMDKLLDYLARDILPHRPDRTEPRAIKRRPKPFSFLTKPRSHFKEPQHRNHYTKQSHAA